MKRAAARDQIKEILLQRILDGTYTPGERLVELKIAQELNTSQAPVREAFRYLEALRLVETEPYRGTRVRTISDREMEESSEIRVALEQLGAELAAVNLKGNVKALKEEAKLFVAAAKRKDVVAYSEHDIEFHRIIIESSGNKLLLSTWESIVLESRFRKTLARIGDDQLLSFGHDHYPVIESLNKGDGESAGKHLRSLICRYHGLSLDHKGSKL